MDTSVTVEIVPPGADGADCADAVERAFGWFAEVEARCSRFDPESELRRLAPQTGRPVVVSPLLLQAVGFALKVAKASGGAFDPTVGRRQEARGFDRNYRTGAAHPSGIDPDPTASWRDVRVNQSSSTITLRRPILLDLGAVAKGLAIDLALHELGAFAGAAVEAGGDLAVRGTAPGGGLWRIGIRHPRRPEATCAVLAVSDAAVCTSGDYERLAPTPDGGNHLLDPRTGRSVEGVASCTVVAPNAVMADALGTAACVLGPAAAIPWLERQGAEAMLLTPALRRHTTPGFARYEACL